MEKNGINYIKPTVILLQDTGIGVSEFGARTCYDSFKLSENEIIENLNDHIDNLNQEDYDEYLKERLNNIEHSELLDTLAWTYFHHSVLEHINLSFLIKSTSRGVLQELVRHRIASYSVKSTRYTMSSVLNCFIASRDDLEWFIKEMLKLDLFVTTDEDYNILQIKDIFNKLSYQKTKTDFYNLALSKSGLEFIEIEDKDILFEKLQNSKKKRNVGDSFKHIVNDNWKVDLIMTMNLRSLKNFFKLRDSGAAYFQIQWLAKKMKKSTPNKYLNLIIKENSEKEI